MEENLNSKVNDQYWWADGLAVRNKAAGSAIFIENNEDNALRLAVTLNEYHEGKRPWGPDTITRLKEALQSLYDVQNGPPLEKYRVEWEKAMQVAEELLK